MLNTFRFTTTGLLSLLLMLLALGFATSSMAEDDNGDGPPTHAGPPGGEGPPGRANPPEGRGPGEGNGPPANRGPRLGTGRDRQGDRPGGIPMFCTPGGNTGGPAGQSGLSSIAMLDFGLPDGDGDASGKLMYRWIAPLFDFVFNARGLEAETAYSLIAYPKDDESANGEITCLGTATSTTGGTFHLQNALDIETDLPPLENGTGENGQPLATIALISHESGFDCTQNGGQIPDDAQEVLQSVEGMFYVRHVDEDEENGNDNG